MKTETTKTAKTRKSTRTPGPTAVENLPYITESEAPDMTRRYTEAAEHHRAGTDIEPDDRMERRNVNDADAHERTQAINRKYKYPWPLGKQFAKADAWALVPEEPSEYDPTVMVAEHYEILWQSQQSEKPVVQRIFPAGEPSFKRAVDKRTNGDLSIKNRQQAYNPDGSHDPTNIDIEEVLDYLLTYPIEVLYDLYTGKDGKPSKYPAVMLWFPEDRMNKPMKRNWIRKG